MLNFIDWFLKSYLFWAIVVILFFSLLILLSIIINKYVDDVFKLTVLIYAIYFPIGAFMGGDHLITTKQWVPKGNLFTISFLYITILMILLITGKYLTKYLSKKSEYEINRAAKYMLLGDRITKENRETSLEIFIFITLYSNIFIGIYTLIGFYSLLVKWVS